MNKFSHLLLLSLLAGCSVEQPVDTSDTEASAKWIAHCHQKADEATDAAQRINWKIKAYTHAEQAGALSPQDKALPAQVLSFARKTKNKNAFCWALDQGALPPIHYYDLKEYTSLRGIWRDRVLALYPETLPVFMSLAIDINNVEFFNDHAAEQNNRGFEIKSPLETTEFKMRYHRFIGKQLILALKEQDADRIRFLIEMTPNIQNALYLDEETHTTMREAGAYVFYMLKDEDLAVMMVKNHYVLNPVDFETLPFGAPFLQAFRQVPADVIRTQGFETRNSRMSDTEAAFLTTLPEAAWDLLSEPHMAELMELSMKMKESDAAMRLIRHKENRTPLTQSDYNELINWAVNHENKTVFEYVKTEGGELNIYNIDLAALARNQELFMQHAPKILMRIYYTMDTAPRPDGTTIGRIKQAFGCGNEEAGLFLVQKYDLSAAWKKATNGQTLLMDVCHAGNLKAAKYLIETRGENLREKTGYSELQISIFGSTRPCEGKLSPIFFAAKSGNPGLIEYLISKGADVNARSNFKTTPLMHAVSAGNLAAAKILIDHRADVNATMSPNLNAVDLRTTGSYEDISTALRRARSTRNQAMMDLLQQAGASL